MFTYPEKSISREQDPILYNLRRQKNNLKEMYLHGRGNIVFQVCLYFVVGSFPQTCCGSLFWCQPYRNALKWDSQHCMSVKSSAGNSNIPFSLILLSFSWALTLTVDDSGHEGSVGAVFFPFCCAISISSVLTIPSYHEVQPRVTETWPLKNMPVVQVSQFLPVKLMLMKIYQKGEWCN